MDVLAPINRYVIAPLWALWERSPYLCHYRRLLHTQYDSSDVIANRQWKELTKLVGHAYETTVFWRKRLDAANIHPDSLKSFEQYRKIPILTKDDLRSRGAEIISNRYDRKSLIKNATSGSTGVSIEVFANEETMEWKRACTLRSDEWSGWRLGERVAMIWGNPKYTKYGWRGRLRNRLLDRRLYLDTLKMNESAMYEFSAKLQKQPPSLFFGHAHSVYVFARFLESHSQFHIQPKGIIVSAMVLHDWERRTIEKVFHCPVTNRYGCEEVGLIACECEQHAGLHINADGIYLEVLRPDGTPAEENEPGMVIVTALKNFAMPIIRYQIGDMAALTNFRCPCGRGLPMIKNIEGRVADYVVTPSGELISGISLTENFALMVTGVSQWQIIQEKVDHFVFKIVKGQDFGPASLEQIRSLVTKRFGANVDYECEFVDRITREPSGKYRFCISKVPNPYTAHCSSVAESSGSWKG